MTPTPEQIHVFRKVEKEAQYGNAVSEDDMTAQEQRTAHQLADMGWLTIEDGDFEITSEGQAAFADCGR